MPVPRARDRTGSRALSLRVHPCAYAVTTVTAAEFAGTVTTCVLATAVAAVGTWPVGLTGASLRKLQVNSLGVSVITL